MLKFLAYRYENYTQTPKVAQMAQLFKKLAEEVDIDDEIPIFDLGKPAGIKAIKAEKKGIYNINELYKGDIYD